jgi:hypothetical protein
MKRIFFLLLVIPFIGCSSDDISCDLVKGTEWASNNHLLVTAKMTFYKEDSCSIFFYTLGFTIEKKYLYSCKGSHIDMTPLNIYENNMKGVLYGDIMKLINTSNNDTTFIFTKVN